MGTARQSQPWRRPIWLEPRLWILLLLIALLLPWSTSVWFGTAVPLWDAFPPEQLFLEGWSIFVLFGLPYLAALVLALVAFTAATLGWVRAALVAAFGSSIGAVNVVLLLAANRNASMQTATPLALSVVVGLPAPVLLARAFVHGLEPRGTSRARGRLGLSLGLLGFMEFLLALMAIGAIIPAPSGGLSSRTYPELAVFLLWVGGWILLGIALPLLAWASRASGPRAGIPAAEPEGRP